MRRRIPGMLAIGLLLAGCGWEPPGESEAAAGEAGLAECRVARSEIGLAPELRETSGVSISRRDPALLWTISDSGNDPVLHALRPGGELAGAVRVTGAENRDWEDLAAGPCPAGDCLYVADIGDNDAEREAVSVHRVPEPDPGARATAPAETFRMRYPDGPRDAEALFLLGADQVYLITKGRNSGIALYRYPGPLRAGETATLERVRDLGSLPFVRGQLVTGAEAAPGGEWVAVRTYSSLGIFAADSLLGGGGAALTADLTALAQPQGEGVALGRGGVVVLTSEGEGSNAPAGMALLRCPLDSLP